MIMTESSKELDGDLKEFQTLVSNFFSMNYPKKCNQLKEKEVLLQKTQKELTLAKESEQNIKSHCNHLQEILNQYKEILDRSASLEGEINKILMEKSDIQALLEAEREIHNSDRESWNDEKSSLSEKFTGEIEMLRKKNLDEISYMKDGLTMEIRELQRKLTSKGDELAFARLDHEAILRQAKTIYEERLKKMDNENTALKEELNYWRHRTLFSPSPRKEKDVSKNESSTRINQQTCNNLKSSLFNKNNNVCFKESDYEELNKYGSIKTIYQQDNQEVNQTRINQSHNQNYSSIQLNDNDIEQSNYYNQMEKESLLDHMDKCNGLTMNGKGNENYDQLEVMEQNFDNPDNSNLTKVHFTTGPQKATSTNLICANISLMNSPNKAVDPPATYSKSDVFMFASPPVSNELRESSGECNSLISRELKPKAVVNPIKKKVPFPVIKKKKLLNPNQDFF